jgi:hypothetical protein
MVEQLRQVVELMQKPFEPSVLVDTKEGKRDLRRLGETKCKYKINKSP